MILSLCVSLFFVSLLSIVGISFKEGFKEINRIYNPKFSIKKKEEQVLVSLLIYAFIIICYSI